MAVRQPLNCPHKIGILNWNARSIRPHALELADVLESYSIDIAYITETFLRPRNSLFLANFTIHRRDRPDGNGGGVALLVRSNIAHSVWDTSLFTGEAIGIKINSPQGPLKIASVYSPPGASLTSTCFINLFIPSHPTIIAGDLNAKHPAWHSINTNRQGRSLFNSSIKYLLSVEAPSSPTHFPNPGCTPDVLDVFVTSSLHSPRQITLLNELSSDHLPVLLTIDFSPQTTPSDKQITNLCTLRTILEVSSLKIPILRNTDDVDTAIIDLTTDVTNATAGATYSCAKPPLSNALTRP